MLGLDTNVLVRYVTRDDPAQARRARSVLERATERGEHLFVDAVVLCELVWVLRSAYGHPRESIARVLETLLSSPEIVVEDADLARKALRDAATGGADFVDAFIGRRNERSGCERTVTFDKRLSRHDCFRVL